MSETTIMQAHKVCTLRGAGHTQREVADKLGISVRTVRRIELRGPNPRQYQLEGRRVGVGLGINTRSFRTVPSDSLASYSHGQDTLFSRDLAVNDPLAILLAAERFGRLATLANALPIRIDTPTHDSCVVREGTWQEFVGVHFKGNEQAAYAARPDGSSRLAREGADTSSYAVRDTRYDWGYPYRNTVLERNQVAALSIVRRRARARRGLEFLISLDPVLKCSTQVQYENSTSSTSYEVSKEPKHLRTEEQDQEVLNNG